ncbi:FecCD family ABC transporter permease [Agromyces archimandritae]|uniref:Iron chelate uptake ABC transporter family permease subunit n=1 Tax=Agromyces archimandritae TaxID=2781962 RepID=A0A975IQE2_9MICO|nr:iron chelate uptake ABC transporter family permease subunit [Agromyces archimandritae]QTX04941.1 iron chelate uptake ABC transporter family permease subunit [Agromyces archimandritae]
MSTAGTRPASPAADSPAARPRRAPGGRIVVRIGRAAILVHPRSAIVTAALAAAAILAAAAGLAVGTLGIPLAEVPAAVLGFADDARQVRVAQGIRLPRAVTALAAGAALGVAGAVFQSLSRNALGSPDVIGFTTGAATGAIAQIVLFDGDAVQVALGAAVGGIATAGVVVLLSSRGGSMGGSRLVLVGIGVGAIMAAVNDLLLVKGDLERAVEANLWRSGSLDARTWEHAVPVLIAVIVLLPAIAALIRRANLMELGDDLASQLGVPVERTRLLLVALAVLLTAAATAAVGPIAFVALAAPQLVRRLNRSAGVPVWGSAAMGALLLTIADVVTRLLPVAFQVPIGRMTGIVGGLYLIWLLLPGRNRAKV